jgi:hypothetical protein
MVNVMLDRVQTRAAALRPSRALQGLVLGPFWLVGAAVGALTSIVWSVAQWLAAAITTGYRDAAPNLPTLSAEWLGRLTLAAIITGVVLWATL